MKDSTIACLGAGNMGRSLLGGLIANGFDARHLVVSEPGADNRQLISRVGPVRFATDNREAVQEADAVIIAVKPQVVRDVCTEIAPLVAGSDKLVISIAAGIRTSSICQWLGPDVAVVRAMPNTPALVQTGASALYANDNTNAAQRDLAEAVLRAVGLAVWVNDEGMLDTVTALSGSGPAYFFLLIEALSKAAAELGLDGETAHLLAVETALGAARMALESNEDPETLRRMVTSPGGTTERAIGIMLDADLPGIVRRAVIAARDRSAELADEFGKD